MSVQMTLQQKADGLDVLRELVDLIKSPEALAVAAETTRKQLALTSEEEAKVGETRKLLAEADALKADLQSREDVLTKNCYLLDDERETFQSLRDSEVNRLKALSADLERKDAALGDKERKLLDKEKALDEQRKAMDDDYEEMLERANAEAAKNAATAEANVAEFVRLKEFEEVLKAKAAKLRESAADI